MQPPVFVQYGAGWSAAEGWLNYDSSPSVWLERLPLIGRHLRVNAERFPEDIRFGNILTGLPVADGSVRGVYASHVLEHLSHDDFKVALANTYRLLEPGGVFRAIVPDLESRANRYLARVNQGDPGAAEDFMEQTLLGRRSRPKGLKGRIRALLGNTDHLWMWDEASMIRAFKEAGFEQVRRCAFGDAADPAFALVESPSRFHDEQVPCDEVAIEGVKPI